MPGIHKYEENRRTVHMFRIRIRVLWSHPDPAFHFFKAQKSGFEITPLKFVDIELQRTALIQV